MNILFIEEFLNPCHGGVEKVTFTISKALEERGHKCYIAFTNIDDATIPENKKLKYSFNENYKTLMNKFSYFIENHKISVIINQQNYQDSIYKVLSKLKKEKRIKLITVDHMSPDATIKFNFHYYSLKDRLHRIKGRMMHFGKTNFQFSRSRMYNLSDKFVVLSAGFFNDFMTICKLHDKEKMIAIQNPLTFKENYFDINKKKQVLIVARLLDGHKNITGALRIWKIIQDHGYKDWNLVVVGDGQDKDMILNYSKSLNLQNIEFLGSINNPQYLYRESQIFMMTSHFEGFGLTLTESFQNACIPIAFGTYSSVYDIIKDHFNGFIIPKGDEEKYALCIEQLMDNIKLREQIKLNAFNSAFSFSIERITEKWEALLHN